MKKTHNAKLTAKPPALRSLPLTDEPLELNITRAYLQGAYCENLVTGEPLKLDPCKVGWEEDPYNPSLLRPVIMSKGLQVAPEEVLRITKCNCSSMFTLFFLILMLFIQPLTCLTSLFQSAISGLCHKTHMVFSRTTTIWQLVLYIPKVKMTSDQP